MHKKRIMSIMLTFILFISLIIGNCSDVKALVIDSKLPAGMEVEVVNNELSFGDTGQIIIKTTERESNLGNKAYIVYKNDGDNKKYKKEFQLVRKGNSFVADFYIDENFKSGLWKIDFVVVSKNDNNVVVYNDEIHNLRSFSINHRNMSHGDFHVGEFADYELFDNVSANISNAKLLDTVLIKIETTDRVKGMLKNAFATYVLEDGDERYSKEITLDLQKGNSYESKILIDESFRPGTWKLDYIVLKEESGRTEIVYNKEIHGTSFTENFKMLSKGNFTVERDMEGPEITSLEKVKLDNMPGTYRITVGVEDESKLNERAWLKYVSKINGIEKEKDILLTLQNGKYVGTFVRDDFDNWEVDYILFKDVLDNSRCVYNRNKHNVESMDFEELAIREDDRIPSIDKMTIEKDETDGSYILKIAPGKDESGLISTAYALYVAESEEIIYEKEVRLEMVDGIYQGKFSVNEYDNPLVWNMKYVILRDKRDNTGIFYNSKNISDNENFMNMDMVSFNSNGEDVEGPELLDISLSKGQFNVNNQLEVDVDIQVRARDLRGEIGEWAYVVLKSNNFKKREVKLQLKDDVYAGTVRFFQGNAGEKWSVDYVLLKDDSNNDAVVYNSDVHGFGEDMSENDISIEGVQIGINRINVDTRDMSLTKIATIEIETKGITGKGYGYVLYRDFNGNEREIKLSGEDGVLRGEFDKITEGDWNLSYVIIGDAFGNREVIYNSILHGNVYPSKDLSGAMIEVEFQIPRVKSVSVSNKIITLYDNETSTFEIVVGDKAFSGYNAYVKYVGENFEGEFKLNRLGDKFTGEIKVEHDTPEGEIEIDYIILKSVDEQLIITYNSKLHGFGEDLSEGNIQVKNPEVGLDILSIGKEKSVLEIGDNSTITLKVAKGAFPLMDKAYIMYIQDEEGRDGTKEIQLNKIDENTYQGTFQGMKVEDLGNWKVDFVIVKDEGSNTRVIYNSEVNGFGEDISSGNLRVGEIVVYGINDTTLEKERDFVQKYLMRNYGTEDKEITLNVETRDQNNKLLSKIAIKKFLGTGESDVVNVRMRIKSRAKYMNVILVDGDGNEIYKILDNAKIK